MKAKNYTPNTAYPTHGNWAEVWNQVKQLEGKPIWIELELTPDLFDHSGTWASGIVRAKERGYLAIQAWLGDDNNVHLSVIIDQDTGDGDGFGVEPDDYLVGIVAPDGTFIEPLHIR